jgi:hypothetical protein
MYSCVCVCQTNEAGVQRIAAHPGTVWNYIHMWSIIIFFELLSLMFIFSSAAPQRTAYSEVLYQMAAHLKTGSPLKAGEIAGFEPRTAVSQSGVATNEPLHHCSQSSTPPPTQATQPSCPSHFRLSLLAVDRGMDLDGVHQEASRTDKSVVSKCWTMCMIIAIYFLLASIIFLWNTSQISCLLSFDCYYLLRLINHNSGIKAPAYINHIVSGALLTVQTPAPV